ncbi:hypothetical protein K491DRAFT_344908 [Lophiostoma macrostomum CBS 122681]|uniref:Uncharacterized protein n=1 Tax=Lophiostoma macrostomum CBS 122681 TaxID=1314788 RepID=A0A6A6TE08_9PLEO|nr:hypothetical protein K491DRAFT_344908 [Lophiostoma macrostomum CBS 122681]
MADIEKSRSSLAASENHSLCSSPFVSSVPSAYEHSNHVFMWEYENTEGLQNCSCRRRRRSSTQAFRLLASFTLSAMIATLVLWLLYEQDNKFGLIMRGMTTTEKVDFVMTTEEDLFAELHGSDIPQVVPSELAHATEEHHAAVMIASAVPGRRVTKRAIEEDPSPSLEPNTYLTDELDTHVDADTTSGGDKLVFDIDENELSKVRTADAQLHPLLIPGWLPGRPHFPPSWQSAFRKIKYNSTKSTNTSVAATPISTTFVVETNASRVQDVTFKGWPASTPLSSSRSSSAHWGPPTSTAHGAPPTFTARPTWTYGNRPWGGRPPWWNATGTGRPAWATGTGRPSWVPWTESGPHAYPTGYGHSNASHYSGNSTYTHSSGTAPFANSTAHSNPQPPMVPPNRPTPHFTTCLIPHPSTSTSSEDPRSTNTHAHPALSPRGGSPFKRPYPPLILPPSTITQLTRTLGALPIHLPSRPFPMPLHSLSASDWAALYEEYAHDARIQALITAFATALSPEQADGRDAAQVHAFLDTLARVWIPVGVGRVRFDRWGADAARVLSKVRGGEEEAEGFLLRAVAGGLVQLGRPVVLCGGGGRAEVDALGIEGGGGDGESERECWARLFD